jgi:hypothetical protein
MRHLDSVEEDPASVVLVRWALLFPTALFACLTVETHLARAAELTFEVLAIVAAGTTLVVGGLACFFGRREWRLVKVRDTQTIILLGVAALVGGTLASIYAYPDGDDHLYVPEAVHAMTYPSEPMGYTVHFLFKDPPIQSLVVGTAQPYEYAQALLASLFRVDFLTVYHIWMVALVGAAVPLAAFSLLRHFSDDTASAAVAAGMSILILTLMGETKYTPGSLSFTRLFQNKSVLLTAGVPYLVGESVAFLRRPGLLRWAHTGIIATALTGLSSTAFFLIPMMALGLGIASVVSLRNRRPVLLLACYGASMVYLVMYGLYASRTVASNLGSRGEGFGSWPAEFSGYVTRVFDFSRPFSPSVMVLGLALGIVFLGGWRRVFLMVWVGVSVLLFANPLVMPFWIRFATGPAIYWRVYFAVPAVGVIGFGLLGVLHRMRGRPGWRSGLLFGISLLIVVLTLIPGSPSIFRGRGTIGWPRLKVSSEALEQAETIVESVPPGVMLAQEEPSGVIGMVRGGYPQLRIRVEPMHGWLSGSEGEGRIAASDFTGGDLGQEDDFRAVVGSHSELAIVLIRQEPFKLVTEFLRSHGFTNQLELGEHMVVWRDLPSK